MTNYNLYRVFYYVALEKNITKASEKLFISQPAVSSSIKELENEVGQTLFERQNKGVKLTTFGEMLFSKIKPVVLDLEKIETLSEKYNQLNDGVLRIGSSSSNVNQLLMEYLKPYIERYPNIKIIMKRDNKENLLSALKDNDLDVIFVDKGNENLFELCEVKEYDIKYQLIGNKEYKEKYSQNDISIENFPFCDLMVPSKNNKSRKFIEDYFKNYDLELNCKYELDNYILLYDFVKNGFGLAFVNADYYKKNINEKEVYIIFPSLFLPVRKMICYTNKSESNKALEEFLKIIKD